MHNFVFFSESECCQNDFQIYSMFSMSDCPDSNNYRKTIYCIKFCYCLTAAYQNPYMFSTTVNQNSILQNSIVIHQLFSDINHTFKNTSTNECRPEHTEVTSNDHWFRRIVIFTGHQNFRTAQREGIL